METVTVKAQVVVPRVPNFLHMAGGQVIPVEAIATEGLEELGRGAAGMSGVYVASGCAPMRANRRARRSGGIR